MVPNAPSATIPLFLYGTLRSGYNHHKLIAPYLVTMCPAQAWGRLYQLQAGYPAMEVPAESVLAEGTSDATADAETADRCTVEHSVIKTGDWDWVQGDVVLLEAPARCLPPIDAYEDFRPGKTSLYRRVLITVIMAKGNRTAWTYVRRPDPADIRIVEGSWSCEKRGGA